MQTQGNNGPADGWKDGNTYVEKWVSKHGQTIICRDDGSPYNAKYFRDNCYYPTLEKLGITKRTPHCTRHTYATLLYKKNVTAKAKQSLLGHTSETMTNHYTHLDVQELKKAVSDL